MHLQHKNICKISEINSKRKAFIHSISIHLLIQRMLLTLLRSLEEQNTYTYMLSMLTKQHYAKHL